MMFQKAIKQYLDKHGFGAFDPKAVLFDMDGVLYDSMPNHVQAWQKSMAQFGLDMDAADAYATEGMKGVDTIRMLTREQQGKEISEAEAQRMYDVKSRLFHEMPTAPVFDGVIDLMRKIRSSGLQVGIVTGSGQKPLIRRLIDDFSAFVDEAHIVTAYNIRHGKPAPDPYLKGLEQAGGLHPWQGIVVENAPLGVRAGVAANIFTVAINSGPLPDSSLLDEGANLLFPTMRAFCEAWDSLLQ